MIAYITLCIAIGVLTEALAYALALWLYNYGWFRIVNVLVTFGLVYGSLSWALAAKGFLVQFAAGAALGLVNEYANDRVFRAWYFPGDPWTFLKGRPAVIGVGLSWGLLPPIAVAVRPFVS